jgi:protein-tyrosine-phosphatase
VTANPHSVLFCCDYNAVRSPMAEGMMKQNYGTRIYVQSAGVKNEQEVDGFAVTVCGEIGVALHKHRVRSFHEMEEWGDRIGAYDLIVALSPAAMRQAQEYTRYHAIDVEYWPIFDPTGLGEDRDARLGAYRQARDQIETRIRARFGPPDEKGEVDPA